MVTLPLSGRLNWPEAHWRRPRSYEPDIISVLFANGQPTHALTTAPLERVDGRLRLAPNDENRLNGVQRSLSDMVRMHRHQHDVSAQPGQYFVGGVRRRGQQMVGLVDHNPVRPPRGRPQLEESREQALKGRRVGEVGRARGSGEL